MSVREAGRTRRGQTAGRILGVDIGSTKIAVSLWTGDGERLDSRRFATRDGGAAANLGELIRVGRELLGGGEPGAVGVSAGGPVDPLRGLLLDMPNQSGWKRVALREILGPAFRSQVFVENDANAGALAEWRYGAGQGVADLAFLTLSTGIGAGLVLDGRLYRGSRLLAGEVGHMVIVPDGEPCGCGKRGCLEAYASGAGMARRLAALGRRDPTLPSTAREVVDRARRGEPFSVGFLREVARHLASGLAGLVFLLNPRRIVLGTIAVGAGDLLLDPLREELERQVWPSLLEGLEVFPAALGAGLGDHAAFAVAMQGREQGGR